MNPYPDWLNAGDNAWQLVAATLVGLMSIPGIAVLYGGLVQKKWAVNTMLMAFTGFSLVLVAWVLWEFKMGFGEPLKLGPGILQSAVGKPASILGADNQHPAARGGHAEVPILREHAGLLPVRVRRDYPPAVLGQRGRPDELQGVAAFRSAVVDLCLRRQCVPAVGWGLLGTGTRRRHQSVDHGGAGLLRWICHPPGRWYQWLCCRRGDRTAAGPRPSTRGAQQPAVGRDRSRHSVAGLERVQRR